MATLRAVLLLLPTLWQSWPFLPFGSTLGLFQAAFFGYVLFGLFYSRATIFFSFPFPQNVLAGALFSPLYATILLTTLTTLGSACSTLLSKPLGPFLSSLSPRALDLTRHALGGDSGLDTSQTSTTKSSAWVRLSVLRLIGVVPWSGINIACGVCNVPLADCMLGTFIGCLPWTAVTCQVHPF